MKKIVFFLFLLFSLTSQAQNKFPSVDSLQNYTYRYVKNSSVESFTNLRLQNILIGLSQMVDTLRQNGYVDSIWIGTGDTLKYRIGNSTLVIGKITGGAGADSSIFATRYWTSTQYRPITWVPTLQEVTDAGAITTQQIEAGGFVTTGGTNFPDIRFNDASSLSNIKGQLVPYGGSGFYNRSWSLPNKSGTLILDTDTSAMLSPYLRSNVAAATYQPIGDYLTSIPTLQQVTNAGSVTTNGITAFTISTNNGAGYIGEDGAAVFNKINLRNVSASNELEITANPTQSRTIDFPDTSGRVTVGVRANGTTYMAGTNGIADIGSVGGVTTTTLTDSLNANGITGITLNTSGAIHTNPITFTRSGRTFTGSMSLATQSANRVFAGPTSGGAATPTFRALVDADIPSTSKGVQWAGVDSSFAASMASNGEHEVEEFKVIGSSQTASIFLPGTKYAFVAGSGNAIGFWESGVNAIRLGTLTSTSAAPYLHMGHAAGTASQTYQLSSDWIVMTCRVRIPDLSDGTNTYHLRAGLVTAFNSTPLSGGIVFTYDLSGTQTGSSATSNWQTITASSNTRTYSQNAQNTTSVSANTWTKLQIVASSSVVYFYINGTLVATHTSNLPTAQNLVPYFDIRKTAGATARTFEIDYNAIDIKYSTPR